MWTRLSFLVRVILLTLILSILRSIVPDIELSVRRLSRLTN
jgi:hypothetical protein